MPIGWELSILENLTKNHDGKRIPVSAKLRKGMNGVYPYYGASGIIDYVNKPLFDGKYLLIGEDGANLLARKTPIAFIANGKFWVNNHAHVLTSLGDISLEFLSYFINSINLSNWISGTAQPKLNQTNMNKIPIPLAPLNEQKRIVEKIEYLFSQLDNINTIFVNIKLQLKQHRESLFKFAFEGKLPNLKHMDQSNWERVSYGDICTKITYGFTNPMPDSDVGFWKITATNIKNGKINYENARKTDTESFYNKISDKSRPKKNTVLITKDGTLGNVAIVDRDDICINQSVASLEPIQSKVIPEYLALSLQKPSIKQYIEKFKRATTIAHISITDLAKWELYLPLQNEQKIIVNEIKYYQSLIDKMGDVVNLTLSQLTSLRSTILKQAFEGKLVPQDPNDEPASELLKRIKQDTKI